MIEVGEIMMEKENISNDKMKEFLDNINFIPESDIANLNFYEACLYLEKLNVLDNYTKEENHE